MERQHRGVLWRTEQIGRLKLVFDSIKDPIHDINLICTPDGIYASRLDNAQVCLVNATFPAAELRRAGLYQCDAKMRLGINLSRWYKILKTFEHGDNFELSVTAGSENMTVTRTNQSRSTKVTYTIKLMDLDQEENTLDSIPYTNIHTMSTHDFHKATRDIQAVEGQNIAMASGPNGLMMGSSGDYADATFILPSKDVDDSGATITKKDVPHMKPIHFPLRYINYATKATAATKEVRLYLAPGAPLTVEYNIECLCVLRFIIAQQIDEEDEDEVDEDQAMTED